MDPEDIPTYSPALAGRLVGLSADRVRRWLHGYEYTYPVGLHRTKRLGRKAPVVRRRGSAESRYASFLDLIDLLFVKKFLDHGLTLQRVRAALTEAEALVGGHHFAQRTYFTDGREVYLQVRDEADALLQLLSHGQWVIATIIKQTAKQLDFDDETGFAERWYPIGRSRRVVIDPRIAFGAPTLVDRGIQTSNVYDLFLAEEENTRAVQTWMNLRAVEVHSAVHFEKMLQAA